MKTLSVIIPVYNVEKYLEKCLQSVIAQCTSDTMEVVAVNDGSTDSSLRILKEYESKYPDLLKVIDKKNGGLSDARNYGIDTARGKYLAFIDSDDFISDGMMASMLNFAIKNDCDIVECLMTACDDNEKKLFNITSKAPINIVLNQSEIHSIIPSINVSVCNKLFKKSLFTDNEIRFPKDVVHEDMATTPLLFATAHKYGKINEGTYFYRYNRNDSITSHSVSQRRFNGLLAGVNHLFREADRIGLLGVENQLFWSRVLLKQYIYCSFQWQKNSLVNPDMAIDCYHNCAVKLAKNKLVKLSFPHNLLFSFLYRNDKLLVKSMTGLWRLLVGIKFKVIGLKR